MARAIQIKNKSTNLTLDQLQAFIFVSRNRHCTMKQVADYLSVSPATATSIIDRLVAKEVLERRNDTVDRRIIRLDTVDKQANPAKDIGTQFDGFVQVLSESERATFTIALHKLYEHLNEIETSTS